MTDKAKPKFNELSLQLDEVLGKLQTSDVDVDEAMELYQLGQKLVKQMSERLDKAENKVSRLKADNKNNL